MVNNTFRKKLREYTCRIASLHSLNEFKCQIAFSKNCRTADFTEGKTVEAFLSRFWSISDRQFSFLPTLVSFHAMESYDLGPRPFENLSVNFITFFVLMKPSSSSPHYSYVHSILYLSSFILVKLLL